MEQNDRGTQQLNIASECVECIINQSARVASTLGVDDALGKKLVDTAKEMSKNFSFGQTPPEVATPVYHTLSEILQTEDIYDVIKRHSTQQALRFLPVLQKRLEESRDPFLTSLKIAVAGNVIDLASQKAFDLEKELEKIFDTDFAIDDTKKLHALLEDANKAVVLGDNAGEHVFDKLFIQTLQKLFPHIKFFYFVRSKPIINDVTLKETKEIAFDEVCEVVDSGVETPGFVYTQANQKAKELFDSADLVLSKGMGNYECLSPSHKSPIAFLLKVKCSVVAASLGKAIGDIVCKTV